MDPFEKGYKLVMKHANMSEGPGKSSYEDIEVSGPQSPKEPDNPFSLGDFSDSLEDRPSAPNPKEVSVTDSKFTNSGTTVG